MNSLNNQTSTKQKTFLLEIQEVSGKYIAITYLDDFVKTCKRANIFCKIIVLQENDVTKEGAMVGGGGSDVTFPYNIFEGILSKIKSKTEENQNVRRGIFDGLFSFSQQPPSIKEDVIIDNSGVDVTEKEIDDSYKNLIKDSNYIVRIRIIMFDDSDDLVSEIEIGSLNMLDEWMKREQEQQGKKNKDNKG